MFDTLLVNARVADGSGLPWFRADVALTGDRVAAVGRLAHAEARTRLDVGGMVVAPGFVDAHVHPDLAVFHDPPQEAAVRQGVTTYIAGQDGVAFSPGGADVQAYMRRYTAGFNGDFPTPGRAWNGVGEQLACYDGASAVNVALLIPNGNVRMAVMGLDPRPATAAELAAMRALVRQGMEEGAVGLSSGLDYIPSLYADAVELAALCEEIAPFGGVYVTHMRGYWPPRLAPALEELEHIGRVAGCGVHISHYNVLGDEGCAIIDRLRAGGVDATFDLYPYLYGSTILGMLTLPPEVGEGGIDATLERLRRPATRRALEREFENPRFPLETIRLAGVPHPEWEQYEGMLLSDAVRARTGGDATADRVDFVCDILLATDTATGCVIRHPAARGEADLRALMRHPAMMAGSDGIFVGGRPHPRGAGAFAKYLGEHVRDGTWTLETAVRHLSFHAARRHGLTDRGLLAPGYAADVVVFDPAAVRDRSTYENGRALAEGMAHVFVNGTAVLVNGERTGALPGRGLRRG